MPRAVLSAPASAPPSAVPSATASVRADTPLLPPPCLSLQPYLSTLEHRVTPPIVVDPSDVGAVAADCSTYIRWSRLGAQPSHLHVTCMVFRHAALSTQTAPALLLTLAKLVAAGRRSGGEGGNQDAPLARGHCHRRMRDASGKDQGGACRWQKDKVSGDGGAPATFAPGRKRGRDSLLGPLDGPEAGAAALKGPGVCEGHEDSEGLLVPMRLEASSCRICRVRTAPQGTSSRAGRREEGGHEGTIFVHSVSRFQSMKMARR